MHLARHVDHVLAVIPVLGRLFATESGDQRSGEGVELVPRVVQVVLAVDLGSLRGEEVRERVADRHPTRAAGVDRPGRVQRDELEIDPISRERPAVPVSLALRHDPAQDLVEPRGREIEVDEAGPGDLGALEVRGRSTSSAVTSFAAMSRGGIPIGLASCIARFVVRSAPWLASVGGVSATPPSGSGKPAASSATCNAARSWSRITARSLGNGVHPALVAGPRRRIVAVQDATT